jgi:hypothetical protein
MSVERDNCDERQTRLDRMIAEFREAQSRRDGKPNDRVVESKPDANTKGPLTGAVVPR